MPDIVSKEKRSAMMSSIRGKDTKPELIIRSGLHRRGFRYSLHNRKLPGKPDIKFTKRKAILFINGCFWHFHDCHLFKMPSSRREFWEEKLTKNKHNDKKNVNLLLEKGWRVAIVWECALKGKTRIPLDDILNLCEEWLKSNGRFMEIKGI